MKKHNKSFLPDNFDWAFYCSYYEDLKLAGIETEKKAIDHYLNHGFYEKRLHHPSLVTSSIAPVSASVSTTKENQSSYYGIDTDFPTLCLTYLQPHYQVLEVGCGVGRLALNMATYGTKGSYTGFDSDQKRIEWCRTHLSPAQSNCFFHQVATTQALSDGLKVPRIQFPYNDEIFDFIYSPTLFAHLTSEETQRYLAEISRTLKKGGKAILMFLLWNSFMEKKMGKLFKNMTHHEYYCCLTNYANESANAYHEDTIYQWCQMVGLCVTEVIYGQWSGSSTESLYKDAVIVHKKKINKK